MGRRWWQKEARAKAEQERRAAKLAPAVIDTVNTAELPAPEEDLHVAVADVANSVEETVSSLEQAIEDATVAEHAAVDDESAEAQIEDVQVAGITITQKTNPTQNFINKKKKRR